MFMSATAPTATPPARVAFCTSTMKNLRSRRKKLEPTNAANADAQRQSIVLVTARLRWLPPTEGAALNDGQKQKRNSVPIMAKISVLKSVATTPILTRFFSLTVVVTAETARPK
eukprot:Amastigsp_a509548_95.p4 type:complete len:114 gc:universal Amastigsp_a509548_95:1220-879(-)